MFRRICMESRLERHCKQSFCAAARSAKRVSWWRSVRTEASEMTISGLGEVGERIRRYTVLVQPGGQGSGSGVVWDTNGLIVTNAHVARGAKALVTLWDGREFEGGVETRDPRRDLALLRIAASGLT